MRIPNQIPRPLRPLLAFLLASTLPAVAQVGQAQAQQQQIFREPLNALQEALPLDAIDGLNLGQPPTAKEDPTGPCLEFADGSLLHGALYDLEAGAQDVSWKADDVSAPVRFPWPMIRRIHLNSPALPAARPRTLVRFTDGSWLAAKVDGLQDGTLHLTLADGAQFTAPRAKVDWIYFSQTAPGECYEGPTGMDGWESDGRWRFEDGALRADYPSTLWRNLEALPDQVEYLLEVDQTDLSHGEANFAATFQSQSPNPRAFAGGIRFIVQRGHLQMVAQVGMAMQSEAVDVGGWLPSVNPHGLHVRAPLRLRVFYNAPAGRLIAYLDNHKAGEWQVTRIPSGSNRGGFVFQPLGWRNDLQLTISRFRAIPWDGHLPDAPGELKPHIDHLGVLGGKTYEGEFLGVSGSNVQMLAGTGIADVRCDAGALLRLRPAAHAVAAAGNLPDLARIRLAAGGDFEVQSVEVHDGALVCGVRFGDRLTIPLSLIEDVQLYGANWTPSASQALLFKNGDQLAGRLDAFASGETLRWRVFGASEPVEVQLASLESIRVGGRASLAGPDIGALALLRNGDTLPGDLVSIDRSHVVLDTSAAGQLALPRLAVQKLYFATRNGLPVEDASWFPDRWLSGPLFPPYLPAPFFDMSSLLNRPPINIPPSPWSYSAGVFSAEATAAQPLTINGLSQTFGLGCIFDAMPGMAEFSFDVTSPTGGATLSAQIFWTPSCPGYVVQIDPTGVNVYDTGPRRAAQALAQQHFVFGNKVSREASTRHFRFLADRFGGKLAVVVDGVLLGQLSRKGENLRFPLGNAVTIIPQFGGSCTASNVWIGPWNGQLPGDLAGAPEANKNFILLENGDLADGTITSARPDSIQIESELGPLDLPIDRISSVDFGSDPAPHSAGPRLRLRGGGVLTAASWQFENGEIQCHCAAVGDLTLPLTALQEIDFTSGMPAAPTVPARAVEDPAAGP